MPQDGQEKQDCERNASKNWLERLRQALSARITFFNDLRALTCYMAFDAWDDLFRFMEEGLEIAPAPP